MDLIIVDVCHKYEYVKSDSKNAFRILRPKGWILWPDYRNGWSDVDKYFEELVEKKISLFHIPSTHLVTFISED